MKDIPNKGKGIIAEVELDKVCKYAGDIITCDEAKIKEKYPDNNDLIRLEYCGYIFFNHRGKKLW